MIKNKLYLKDPKCKIYSETIDRLMLQSQILNGGNMQPNICTIFFTRENVKALLYQIQGNAEGLCGTGIDSGVAKIPFVEMRLSEIDNQFKNYQKQQVLQGKSNPTEMPQNLLNERLKFEGQLFILNTEIEELNRRLKTFADAENVISESKVLQYGLICSGALHGIGTGYYESSKARAELDSQFLTMVPEGFLIIDDTRSPYDQMKVSDYHKLAKQWVKDRLERELVKFKALQATCKAEGKPIPQQQAVTARKKVSKDSLPKWPEYAIKYEPEKPKRFDLSESVTNDMKRTKK